MTRPRVLRRLSARAALGLAATPLVILLAVTAGLALSSPAQAQAHDQTQSRAQGQALPPPAPNTALGKIMAASDLISMPWVYPTSKIDYLYTSGIGTPHVPVWTFKTLPHLKSKGDALPALPPWVATKAPGGTGPVWSPTVAKIGDHYVMWFAATWRNPSTTTGAARYLKCLGVATATSPLGPFAAPGETTPALCQVNEYGDIDPRIVKIGGQWWLDWKSNDNVAPTPMATKLWAQRLGPDGTTLKGQPSVLYQNDKAWQGSVVESPQMVAVNGHDYLFFSGNGANSAQAGIGLALCHGPSGPCDSPYQGPWLGSNLGGSGPSELSLFTQNGVTWLLYTPEATYFPGVLPRLAVSRVAFGTQGPYVASFNGAVPGV